MASSTPSWAAYLRSFSPVNVGPDKDSDKCQRGAIETISRREKREVVEGVLRRSATPM
jgi:hypothetical protein